MKHTGGPVFQVGNFPTWALVSLRHRHFRACPNLGIEGKFAFLVQTKPCLPSTQNPNALAAAKKK